MASIKYNRGNTFKLLKEKNCMTNSIASEKHLSKTKAK